MYCYILAIKEILLHEYIWRRRGPNPRGLQLEKKKTNTDNPVLAPRGFPGVKLSQNPPRGGDWVVSNFHFANNSI